MESHLRVEITPRTEGGPATARIGGAEFRLLDFAVENEPESGAPMLSLVLAPDSLSIGEPPSSKPEQTKAHVSSWGDGGHPDPREGIPGWEPPLGQQVAGHAERVALRQILSPLAYLRRFGGEGGNVAVTA